MKTMIHLRILFLFSVFSSISVYAQQTQILPNDSKVIIGTLKNGLTYYIRHNEEPKQRADFYIVQKVGSILENDDQNGLAHFLEHMAFNGTKNFPGKDLLNYLEKNGVKFGENINAYTSLDETVYNLSNVPTTRDGLIDSSLLILHDWSSFITLDNKEIDDERGVIREEWRQGSNANRRMWKESNKQKFAGSQYAKRDVIGDTAIINNFKYETLKDYYKKWYHPDLQGIIIVGDIDAEKIEASIKKMFDDIPRSQYANNRPIYGIDDNDTPIISEVTDKEARITQIELAYKHDKLPSDVKKSMNGYVLGIINSLINNILSERFDEITQKPDAPFIGGGAGYGELVKSKDAFQMVVIPKDQKDMDGLNAVLLEAEKVKRFGFTNSELNRAKTNILKNIENIYNNREHKKNESYVGEYIRNFLSDEPIPGIEWEYNFTKMVIPQLKLEDINKVAESHITDKNMIVAISAPEKEGYKVPAKDEILAAINQAKLTTLTAKAEEKIDSKLIDKKPLKAKILKIKENKDLDATEWNLSNGMKVIIKPTKFKKDEILMSSYSFGGSSKFQDTNNIINAGLASQIVENNGIANFNSIELGKKLTGKIASVTPLIGDLEQTMSGSCAVSDLETMLQLTYLYFTSPRKDDDSFKSLINNIKTSISNKEKDPSNAFSDTIQQILSNHSKRVVSINSRNIDKVNQDIALQFYKERFAHPADFTFIFVGDIDPKNEKTKNVICTYLGGLRSKKSGETYTDNHVRSPKGKVSKYFEREMEVKKATNLIVYGAQIPYTMENKVLLSTIEDILNIRYIESIREKEGASYGVGVLSRFTNRPENDLKLMMYFDTDPEKEERMKSLIHKEVDEIINNGPKKEDVQKVKENMLKKYNEDVAENGWWSGIIKTYYIDNQNYVSNYKKTIEDITPTKIQQLLKAIASQGNLIEIIMSPKK